MRVPQFDKVSWSSLSSPRLPTMNWKNAGDAETVLQKLGLQYRSLCFPQGTELFAAKCYDFEAFAPALIHGSRYRAALISRISGSPRQY
jgi:seryl-tRNA synthetase